IIAIMSVRRVRGSFRGSLRRYGSVEANKKTHKHFQWIFRNGEWRIGYEDGDEVTLMYAKYERLPMKDFGAEVRASMDVDQFLNQAVLLLDVQETSLEGVVDRMLQKVLDTKEPTLCMSEAKAGLFTHDSMHMLTRTIQGTYISEGGGFDYDQSWICAMCSLPSLQRRHVAIARLKTPANMGRTSHEVRFFILVLTPSKEVRPKNLNSNHMLLVLCYKFRSLASSRKCWFAKGLWDDMHRRASHYLSDFTDGVRGHKTIHKTVSTTFFLYFACLLPTIAFGALNDNNTNGKIDVRKSIIGQTIGGLLFALLGGQPLVIIMTTAPLALYIKVIYSICEDFNLNFYAMYACVGLWNTLFLVIYALCDASRLMRFSTRSTEEIFSLFISIAFCVDAGRDAHKNFQKYYHSSECTEQVSVSQLSDWLGNSTNNSSQSQIGIPDCKRENSLLFLLLMFGTVWLAVSLYNFNKTPYLQASKREMLADYALPVAVITLSFIGSFVFQDIRTEHFHYNTDISFTRGRVEELPWTAAVAAMGLGFALSLLFFMDQNISAAMVNNPCNKLKKGPGYHLDLFVVGILNGFLSLFGLPWMHGVLPHSPLHVRSLADVEERVEQGHIYEIIVKVRETRVTGIVSHILIGLSILLLPYPLGYIPIAVLNGLFLYMAVTSLNGNQMFERITLLFMEQTAYPPNHYIRRCPQRKIHVFTLCQVIQLAAMCFFGFSPWSYVKMVFPVIILLLLPIRRKVIPYLIQEKFLEALDGEHQ
ncbi:sodium bicarbonate transporter-like protein 11, partial [Limulus polyphemus]|uniref:Sodium bicarbonate transporter-like protein 11 n=1 Tax=Limulus polyphemus TaxID=6850 RepID=A0ABM1S608_LIMPO